jgi:hypothetical protein
MAARLLSAFRGTHVHPTPSPVNVAMWQKHLAGFNFS